MDDFSNQQQNNIDNNNQPLVSLVNLISSNLNNVNKTNIENSSLFINNDNNNMNIPKKNNKIVPYPAKQNNLEMQHKITTQNKVRPITGIKHNQRSKLNLVKKSNTPKKISVINLNEEVSIKESKKSKDNIPNKKINSKENVKKMKNLNLDNNNINKNNNENKNLSIIDQMANLTSIYNALTFINLKLDSTFSSQKEEAERILNEKYNEAIELKEKNFKLFQQINSMSNIYR